MVSSLLQSITYFSKCVSTNKKIEKKKSTEKFVKKLYFINTIGNRVIKSEHIYNPSSFVTSEQYVWLLECDSHYLDRTRTF